MSTKLILSLTLLVPLLCQCAREDKPKSPVVKVELKGSCDLKNIGGDLSKFAKGQLSDAQAGNVWSCAGKAVNDFDRIANGDLQGGDYSPGAVSKFFEKYFLDNRTIDAKLLGSIMRLKQVLVGGDTSKITRRELGRLQDLVSLMRELSVAMNPYAKVIFMNASAASDEEILSANQAFDMSIRRIGEWLGVQNQKYSFSEAKELVRNLREWKRKDKDSAQYLEDFEKVFDVVPSLKQILLSGEKDGLYGADWLPLTQALGQAHCALLALKYSFKENLVAGLNRGVLPHGVDKFVSVLDNARRLHASQEIPLSEWSELFQKIEETKWLNEDFTAKALDNALSWAVNRVLNGTAGKTQTAIKEIHLRNLRKNLERWTDLRAYVLKGEVHGSTLEAKFEAMLNSSPPAEWDSEGRQIFTFNPPDRWTKESKLNMIWPYVIINWLKESFAGESRDYLNEPEMLGAGQEILPVLQGFGWLKQTKNTIGKKLLRESDLFTSSSNGNFTIEVHEATRYIGFVASAFRSAQVWKEKTKNICLDQNAACLRKAALDPALQILAPLPRLTAGFKKNPVKEFAKYSKSAEETILGQPVDGTFGTGDVLQAWMIFQYVETFDRHFDADQNEIINLAEGKEAYKLFGPMVGKMIEPIGLPSEDVLAFFTFLLKFGDTPFTMLGGQLAWDYWRWHQNDWSLETERSKLVDVLKQLSKL